MNNRFIGVYLILIIFQAIILAAQNPPIKSSAQLHPGEYLRNDYLAVLERTKSPLKAFSVGPIQSIKVDVSTEGIRINTVLNFNEGAAEFLLQKSGKVNTIRPAGYNTSNAKIEILDSQHVCLGYADFKLATFSYVDSASLYVAKKCISGTYTDEKGNTFIFDDDGMVSFPGKKAKYFVYLFYYPSDRFDYFKSNETDYAFKQEADSLRIYSITGGSTFPDGKVVEPPAYVLKKSKNVSGKASTISVRSEEHTSELQSLS
jgi:hypothetical protein